jgi:hypothetical protein
VFSTTKTFATEWAENLQQNIAFILAVKKLRKQNVDVKHHIIRVHIIAKYGSSGVQVRRFGDFDHF